MLLPLFLLALQPMEIPSLMRESFMIHPSFQAFSLDSNETTTDLPSPVDFGVTVEKKMEPVVVPLSPSAIWDIIIPSITSLKEVKLAVSVAAMDFYCEISDAKIVFINDKTQTLINNFWADVLVATAPFRFGTAELLDEMASSFVQSLEFFVKKVTSWKEEVKLVDSAAAAEDFYNEMTAKFKTTHTWMHEYMSDALIASAPFRLATTDLFDQSTMSATTRLEELSSKFQRVAQDLSNAIDSKYKELYETFETFIGGLSGFDVYLPLIMQLAIAMMTVAILACFLVSITTMTFLGCKILSQAFTQNVVVHNTTDNNGNIFESNLFAFDYDDEGTNMVPFDPSSIAVVISLTFSVDEGIDLIVPSIVIESSAPTRVADDSLVNTAPPVKVAPAAEKNKKENDQFDGPSFVEYRDPQPDFDYEDEDDDDKSSVASAASIESDDATRSTHRHPDRLHFDFFDRRDPHNDFDDDDDEEEEEEPTVGPTADELDSSMEDLLFSFSKMSFKTVSDSEMDDLVNALANF